MDWTLIINWLIGLFSTISDFASFLFTTYTLADLFIATGKLFGNIFAPSHITTIVEVLRNFFKQDSWSWTQNISFTPIELISVLGLVCILIMGVIKLFSIFS